MLIGLSQRVLYHNNIEYDSLEHNWFELFPEDELFSISNNINQNFSNIADKIDILILTGGDDSTKRRITEIKIITEMLKRNKPILGICHGCFLLIDLLEGKVDEIEDHLNTEHYIHNSLETILVNSFHNLVIKKLPNDCINLFEDKNNYCESWIHKDLNIAGIVWHPERMNVSFIPKEILKMIGK